MTLLIIDRLLSQESIFRGGFQLEREIMWLNVSQLLKAPIGAIRDYEVNEVVDIVNDGSQVQGEVSLIRTNRGILAKATLHTEVELSCSRCLNLFSYPITVKFEEEYFPTTDINSGAPLPLPDKSGSFTIDKRHILDLTEAVRQYGLLTIPMKPLCREDCAGLSAIAGHNTSYG